ncbi:hypothetical protein [Saccharomonospora saliphila]|uniref:hypothetical protein n=1 Tax=Saccharomonospora saliphila TaxID=369829 RepID=UPI000662B40E|nr:hypothetical protein [Saccharomonospora saliphila]
MPRPAVALCTVLALTACGAPPAGEDTAATASSGGRSASTTSPTPEQRGPVTFGSQYRFSSGLMITVSSPDTFRPSENAYPSSARAVAFGIKVFNDGEQPYRLSKLSVKATVAGEEIKQVKDAAYGYTGIVNADEDIPAGGTEDFTLAFAVREQPTHLRLTLHPEATETVKAVFTGSV